MIVSGLLPWFGSKRGLARVVVAVLGDHAGYWEPFCGSMSVFLAKPRAPMECLNDLHGDLINLARVVQDERLGPALYRRLRRAWMAEDLHQEAVARTRGEPPAGVDPDRAFWYFICSWQGINGVSGTDRHGSGFAVRFTAGGGNGGVRFAAAVDSIPAWRKRMRQATITRRCGFEVCERVADRPGHLIYADPPYVEKGTSYTHDFESGDHERLAEILNRFRMTRVVVSYYDHPLVRSLYEGWTVIDCSRTKALVNQGMRHAAGAEGPAVAPEILLVNSPLLGEESPLWREVP